MKKIVTIILCLLCAITASALSYASPYKGAGRNGYIYTTSGHRSAQSGFSGFAQAPQAMMATTSTFASAGKSASHGIDGGGTIPSAPIIRGISTSASSLKGGITTYESGLPSGPRRVATPPTGVCDQCHWINIGTEEDPIWICEVCGSEAEIGCDHMDEYGYCWCPVELDWKAMFFMVAIAGAYALIKYARERNPSVTSTMRT